MDLWTAIENRHSVRRYTGEPVTEALWTKLCGAGLAAPSARNGRPWTFIIIRDKGMLRHLASLRAAWAHLANGAGAIVIAGAEGKYLQQDCAAAAENILLAAEGAGLGACWLGLYPNMEQVEAVHRLMELPEDILPIILLAVGHPDAPRAREPRVPDLTKIHFERYGGKP